MANQDYPNIFWDIESYKNLFCVGMMDQDQHIEMHYLVNNDDDEKKVLKALNHYCQTINPDATYTSYNLAKNAQRLIWHFKKDLNFKQQTKKPMINAFLNQAEIKKQLEGTAKVLEKAHVDKKYWYFGYNTLHYDIPMIDHLTEYVQNGRLNTTCESLRRYSDKLISGMVNTYSSNSYAKYAKEVDAAMLNEKMVDRGRVTIGLKTLVGIRGGSIIESESNKSGVSDDIFKDILYNINDVTELRDVVYPGQMSETFGIRRYLLKLYPHLKQNGLTVNDTSAKFVENVVAPDKPIIDDPVVSYMYPAKHIIENLHKNGNPKAKQKNLLEDTKDWYIKNVYNRVAKNNLPAANANLAKFMSIYGLYHEIEGQNWNLSKLQYERYHIEGNSKAMRKELFAKYGMYLPLIDENGIWHGSYVNFSLGGLHGAEVNMKQLMKDRQKIKELKDKYGYISKIPKKAVSAKLLNLIKKQSRTEYKNYPMHLIHEIPYLYKATQSSDKIIDPDEFTPFMYIKKGSQDKSPRERLIDRYKYTSIGEVVHQDFTSYYPTILINLGVFYDGKGRDRYHEVYNHRVAIKKKLKTLEFGSPEYNATDIEQLGYKLILNSASGILDADFDTKLRANNKALEMRIVGQLCTFRIAMALSLEGAGVPSTNTDGIYVSHMAIDENTDVVDNVLKDLYLGIEPEKLYLVSKDSNNRMEVTDGEITSARGGTLTSWSGARVDNRLSHPALSDRIMTYYLENTDLNGDPDKAVIKKCLHNYLKNPVVIDEFKNYSDAKIRTVVYMASWVMRSTSGSIMIDDKTGTVYPGTQRGWLVKTGAKLEKFVTKKSQPGKSLDCFAGIGSIPRGKMKELYGILPNQSKLGNPEIIEYLQETGAYDKYFDRAITVGEYQDLRNHGIKDSQYTIAKSKISGLPENAEVYINNQSLLKMTNDEIKQIYDKIDFNAYVDMIADYADVWQNKVID